MEVSKIVRRGEEDVSLELFVLPPEMIREIILRLPARSIGRFRCVSKLFCSLSSDSSFAESHLDLTIRNRVHRKLIISSLNLYSLDLDSIGNVCDKITELDVVELNYPLKDDPIIFEGVLQRYGRGAIYYPSVKRRSWIDIFGSLNGLVCISPLEGHVFLYNPTTKESKKLPETVRGIYNGVSPIFGFGFDHLTDDYKVVNLFPDDNDVLNASVYSLKADSWRRINVLNYEHDSGYVFSDPLNLNGLTLWASSFQDKDLIVAFDFKADEFREIPIPDEAQNYGSFHTFVFGNLSGRLCLVNNYYKRHDDIWVMNEYGEPSSWTRIRINLSFLSVKPLCSIRNNDEVLLDNNGDMVLYNFKTGASRTLTIREVNFSEGLEVTTYVESLISPNSYFM